MIGAFVCGGLGNQMFQYAAGRALALRHQTSLHLDLASFEARQQFEVPRPFELSKLAIEVAPSTPLTPIRFRLARRPFAAMRTLSGWRTTHERSLDRYDPRFETFPDRTYLYGYWQSWRYFRQAADQIRRELQPRAPLSTRNHEFGKKLQSLNSLSLHVRRGDYVTSSAANQFHGVLDGDFYARAVKYVQERVAHVAGFVFSDDLDWCRNAFSGLGLPLTFVDLNSDGDSWQDLYLMAACRHNIIANSSFSWWGAFLGDGAGHSDRTVIAPRKWFADVGVDVSDRCPPDWVIL